MRSILSIIFAILYLIITLPVLGIIALIGRKHPDTRDRVAMAMIRWVFKGFLFIGGIKVTVKGKENIPADQAALFIGNHRSIYDILLTYPHMTRVTGYVAKRSMEKIPLFSIWMRYIRCLFLDRNNLKDGMQMILDSIKQIKDGKNVFIFPEGTRNKGDEDLPLLPFHEGSFRIATKCKCPIVPVAINNSINIFENHLPWVHATHIIVEYLPPIDAGALTKEEAKHIGATVREQMTEVIERNAALL